MTTENPIDPSLPIPEVVRAALIRRGFTSLTAVQRAVLEPAAQGKNLRISSQTGSGKTVGFGLVLAQELVEPSACRGTVALVITPTRELAQQVRDELTWLLAGLGHVRVEAVTGGSDMFRERTMLRKTPTILVATPGRLLDHIRRGNLRCEGVRHLLLDEADRMLDMGFADELDAIIQALPEERRSHLVSATFAPGVARLAQRVQHEAFAVEGTDLGVANDDIEHVAMIVERPDIYAALVNTLLLAHGERVLVFATRRADTAELADRLSDDGFSVQSLSGDLSQPQRMRALAAFRTGLSDVLVSTDVAARGIDVPDISLVIHAELPNDPDSYTHRSGRTGRAGRKGRSIALVPARARGRAAHLLKAAKVVPTWRSAPTVDEVLAGLRERSAARAQLELASSARPEHLAQAAALLEGHDPVRLVATLLALAEPKLPCEPKSIRPPAGAPRPRPGKVESVKPGAEFRRRTGGAKGDAAGGGAGFVRFSINWGHRKGATARRLLSHVCRRGEIPSGQVGTIQIGPKSATFEVSSTAAGEFETRVRGVDPRDPGLRISRSVEGA